MFEYAHHAYSPETEAMQVCQTVGLIPPSPIWPCIHLLVNIDVILSVWFLQGRKRRYFVLWSNGTFEYYSTSAKKPQDYLKTVDLKHCEDMVAPITMNGRENIVKLTVKQGEKVRDWGFPFIIIIMLHSFTVLNSLARCNSVCKKCNFYTNAIVCW